MKNPKRTSRSATTDPSNPKGWPLCVRVYTSRPGKKRLVRLAAKKGEKGGYTAALNASGDRIQVHVANTPGAVGKAVFDLVSGAHGIPVR